MQEPTVQCNCFKSLLLPSWCFPEQLVHKKAIYVLCICICLFICLLIYLSDTYRQLIPTMFFSLQGTGNVLFDMEQQLQANRIRIQVLEKENITLHNSLVKLKERYISAMVGYLP